MVGAAGFFGVWASAAAGSFARTVVQIVLSWLALEATGSAFVVGVVLAARMTPQLVLGIPAGVLADAVSRRGLVVGSSAGAAVVGLAAGGAAGAGALGMGAILAATVAFGVLDTVRTAATQAYVHDLVRDARVARGIALTNLGAQLLGAVGGVAGGLALGEAGPVATFGLVVAAGVVGAVGPMVSRPVRSVGGAALLPRPACPPILGGSSESPVLGGQAGSRGERGRPRSELGTGRSQPDVWRGLTLLGRNRTVLLLAGVIAAAEVLGFSHMTLLPTFARDVHGAGAAGLGALTAARSAGGVLSLLVLAGLGTGERTGRAFIGMAGLLGVALVGFAAAPSFELALGLLALAGAAASGMDAMGQTLLLRSVGERERGAVMGIWVFSIGSAPLGHLSLGAVAGVVGAPLAQAVSGAALVAVVLGLAVFGPLRRAR